MDYDREDRWATKCAQLAVESETEPKTIPELGQVLGHPYTDEDLESLRKVCKVWGIRTVVDTEHDNVPPVLGGQGRTNKETEDCAVFLTVMLCLALGVLAILAYRWNS